MAHLLGSKACIDSLRIDIDDLQQIVHDVIGKTGAIKCHSWKFPDRLATDVDVRELLERYRHGRNEVDNQVSHVVLFEIIIDRLLLVIHGSWHFLHEMQRKVFSETLDSGSALDQQTCLSIGLVVKKYWTKLLQLCTLLQQHESQRRRAHRASVASMPPRTSSLTLDKFCQTIETSFRPCSSCAKLQHCLRAHGDLIGGLCHSYNLPSSLAQHRCSATAIPEWLSADDVLQWFEHQSNDVDRLGKHLELTETTLQKTKADCEAKDKLCKQQIEANRRSQQANNEVKQSKKILQESYESKIDDMKKEHEREKEGLSEQIKVLTAQKEHLERQWKESNEQWTSKQAQLDQCESTQNELRSMKENHSISNALIKTFEQDRIRLQTELDVVKRDLDERQRELQKERMRIENMIRQEESHQSKQKLLMQSHAEVTQECESLRKQIVELENQRDELRVSLQTAQKQQVESPEAVRLQSLMETNNHVLQEVASLKANIEQLHQQMSEREQMLSKRADSNGQPQQTILAPDNLIHDLHNQMHANELRIDLLRKQNDSFKTSLDNFVHTNRSQPRYALPSETVTPKPKQAPLWLLSNEIVEQQAFTETRPVPRYGEQQHASNRWVISHSDVDVETLAAHPPHSRSIAPTNLVIPRESQPSPATRPPQSVLILPPSSDQNKARPSTTERARSSVTTTKSTRNASSAKTQRLTLNVTHRCPKCQATYDDKRNYDMHKLYCRT